MFAKDRYLLVINNNVCQCSLLMARNQSQIGCCWSHCCIALGRRCQRESWVISQQAATSTAIEKCNSLVPRAATIMKVMMMDVPQSHPQVNPVKSWWSDSLFRLHLLSTVCLYGQAHMTVGYTVSLMVTTRPTCEGNTIATANLSVAAVCILN